MSDWHTVTIDAYQREIDAEAEAEDFRAQWVDDNMQAMVDRLLSLTDYRTEILADYWREADVAYAAALDGDAVRCASIIANLLRKSAAEDARKELNEFARVAFRATGPKYDDLPSAYSVKLRWA